MLSNIWYHLMYFLRTHLAVQILITLIAIGIASVGAEALINHGKNKMMHGIAAVVGAVLILMLDWLFPYILNPLQEITVTCISCSVNYDTCEVEFLVENPREEEIVETGCKYSYYQDDSRTPYDVSSTAIDSYDKELTITGTMDQLERGVTYKCRGYVKTSDGDEYWGDSLIIERKEVKPDGSNSWSLDEAENADNVKGQIIRYHWLKNGKDYSSEEIEKYDIDPDEWRVVKIDQDEDTEITTLYTVRIIQDYECFKTSLSEASDSEASDLEENYRYIVIDKTYNQVFCFTDQSESKSDPEPCEDVEAEANRYEADDSYAECSADDCFEQMIDRGFYLSIEEKDK